MLVHMVRERCTQRACADPRRSQQGLNILRLLASHPHGGSYSAHEHEILMAIYSAEGKDIQRVLTHGQESQPLQDFTHFSPGLTLYILYSADRSPSAQREIE
ncbi:hypothetical protein Tco_0366717 [Tanacetum coccineum]